MARADAFMSLALINQSITTRRNAQPHRILLAIAGVMRGKLAAQPAHLHPHHRIIARAIHRRVATKHRDANGVLGKGCVRGLQVVLDQKAQQTAHAPRLGKQRTGQQRHQHPLHFFSIKRLGNPVRT
ncbi:hypothetical protein D3C87_1431700 [compost metagenome]